MNNNSNNRNKNSNNSNNSNSTSNNNKGNINSNYSYYNNYNNCNNCNNCNYCNNLNNCHNSYNKTFNDFNLTKREKEVLSLIVKGYNNIKISKELFISVDTAKTHVKSIVNKLNTENRIQAAVLAVRLKLESKLI